MGLVDYIHLIKNLFSAVDAGIKFHSFNIFQ